MRCPFRPQAVAQRVDPHEINVPLFKIPLEAFGPCQRPRHLFGNLQQQWYALTGLFIGCTSSLPVCSNWPLTPDIKKPFPATQLLLTGYFLVLVLLMWISQFWHTDLPPDRHQHPHSPQSESLKSTFLLRPHAHFDVWMLRCICFPPCDRPIRCGRKQLKTLHLLKHFSSGCKKTIIHLSVLMYISCKRIDASYNVLFYSINIILLIFITLILFICTVLL